MSEEVLVSKENGVMIITINRPEAKNAVNRAVSFAVCEAIDELESSRDLTVGVLTGAGGTFSAGMDLKAFLKGEQIVVEGRGMCGISQNPPQKPLIAAVEGFALGGGFELAMCCDLVVAAEDAKLGMPEAKRGLLAGGGGLLRTPRQAPLRVAMEMALIGDFIDPRRAYEVGLVNRVTESGGALDVAKDLAAKIAANGPLAVAGSKKIILESREWSDAEMWEKQDAILKPVFASEDAQEGPRAFAEKRSPQWKGK